MQYLISNVYTGKPRAVLMISTSHLRTARVLNMQGNLKYALYEPFIYRLKLYAVVLFIYEKNETALYRQ